MALTSNCDLFVSVNEAGINQIVRHIMRQRPSLFNYGTLGVSRNPKLLCAPIDAAPAVYERSNPLLTLEPPVPIFATNPPLGLDFCLQLTKGEVDFAPGNTIALTPELNPPLPAQAIALHFQVCAGLGCPSDDVSKSFERRHALPDSTSPTRSLALPTRTVQRFPPRPVFENPPGVIVDPVRGDRGQVTVIPTSQMNCFCLDLYATGRVGISGPPGNERAFAEVAGLDIVDIKPDGLENALLCYAKLVLNLGILAGGYSIPNLPSNMTGLPVITAGPTPTSGSLPYNPAVEDDQLKLFINVTPTVPPPTIVPCVASGGGGGGGSGPSRSIGWGAGPTAPPGADHLIVAVSAGLVGSMFAAVRNTFHPCFTPSKDLGPFTARLEAGGHLENGSVALGNDNTITISNLLLKWDTLRLFLDVDIPKICVGGFCIIPNLTGGCAVRAPEICVFEDNPDFTIPLDLSGIITSLLTAKVRPLIKYGVETTRPAGMSDLDAEDAGIPNEWAVFLDPLFVRFEVIDIPDTVADLLTSAVNLAVDNLLGGLPGWAKDLIKSMLGGAIAIVRTVLGIPGNIVDWLSNLIGVDLNLFDYVTTALAQLLVGGTPLVPLEDPFQVLDAQTSPVVLNPVKIPIRGLSVQINADEMTLRAKVGA